jgi:hypothetical protein
LVKTTTRLILDVSLLVGYLIVQNLPATGIPIHEWLSVVVTFGILVHLIFQWDWTVRVVSRFFKKLASLSRFNLFVDILLMISFVAVMLSGFMVSQSVLPLFGIAIPFGPTWRIIHSLCADVALVALGVHVGLHWRWLWSATKLFVRNLGASTTPVELETEDLAAPAAE